MSANNIVVIKKEDDGKFRGYHRDMDAYCEGQYDYDGPCQFCTDGCEMCNYTKHYTSSEETSIFEVDTIEGSIHAYHKWCEESMPVEYGYEFEGLEPNAETVEAMKETDIMMVRDNLKFIFDHITNTNDGFVLVNCTPGVIKKAAGLTLELLNNPMRVANEVESVEELNTDELENLAKECNRLKKILCDNRESMSNKNFIIISNAIHSENVEKDDSVVIETPDDIRRILKAKIEKIEGQIRQLVNNEKST